MTRLPPLTDLTITIKVADTSSDVGVDTATVTGAVYAPNGREVITGVSLTATGSGGLYTMDWLKTWTAHPTTSKAVLGEYILAVSAVNAGITRQERFTLPVLWGNDE